MVFFIITNKLMWNCTLNNCKMQHIHWHKSPDTVLNTRTVSITQFMTYNLYPITLLNRNIFTSSFAFGKQTTETSMADDYEIVAAIDFGTTYSGYAYCSKSDFKRSPPVIKTSAWKSGTGTCDKFMKTPTVVLFDQNGKFDSFGFEAEKKYLKLALRNQQDPWYFFKRFKMRLHQRETEVSVWMFFRPTC